MLFRRLAHLFESRPWLFAVLIVVISAPAAVGIRSLEFDGSPHNIFATSNEDYRFLRQVMSDFGSDDLDCLLMVSSDKLFSQESLAGLRELVRRTEEVEGVERVWSMVPLLPDGDSQPQQLRAAQRQLSSHPLVGGHLLSSTGETTLVIVRLDPERDVLERFEPPVRQLETLADEIAGQFPLQVRLSGIPTLRVEVFRAVQSEARVFTAAGAVLALLTSLLIFRRLSLVIISSFGPLLGAFWTLGAMGLAGQPLNVINVVLPTLVVAVGLTNSIHLVMHIRRGIAEGLAAPSAAADTLRKLGGACTLATSTTAIGFASLLVSQAAIIRQFAMVSAVGVMLSFLAVMLSVPLLSGWLLRGNVHFRLRRSNWMPRVLDLLTRRLLSHARAVVVGGAILTLGLSVSAVFLRPDSHLAETIPRNRPSYQTLQFCNEQFGGAVQVMVVVEWPEGTRLESPDVLQSLRHVEHLLQQEEQTKYPLSILNVLRGIPGPDGDLVWKTRLLAGLPSELKRRFVREDQRRAVVIARLTDLGSAQYQQVFDKLQGDLNSWMRDHPGIRVELTGTPVLFSRNINQMIWDLASSLSLAVVVIFVVITVAFRSLRLGLISILPNMFPLATTSALLVLTGRPLQLSSVLVFTICLGIAVDDTIHFLNRFQQERRQRGDLTLALRRCSSAVGTALVTSTLVLLAGFAALLVSEIPTTRSFAQLACTAMTAALLGDLILLPCLLKCFAGPALLDAARATGTATETGNGAGTATATGSKGTGATGSTETTTG